MLFVCRERDGDGIADNKDCVFMVIQSSRRLVPALNDSSSDSCMDSFAQDFTMANVKASISLFFYHWVEISYLLVYF